MPFQEFPLSVACSVRLNNFVAVVFFLILYCVIIICEFQCHGI